MGNDNIVDMTKGDVTKHLLQFTIPMLIGNLFQQIYNLVDSIIVGRFAGAKALGAVGSVGMVMFLFFSLCVGLSVGVGIIVSQYFGGEDYEKVQISIDELDKRLHLDWNEDIYIEYDILDSETLTPINSGDVIGTFTNANSEEKKYKIKVFL